MLRSDAQTQRVDLEIPDTLSNNVTINNEIISEIEKELQDNPYDLISLVFLLYDVPDTALQRLIVFQQISKDAGCSTNLNLLHEWFQHAKNGPYWKHEFIEALLTCQLYSILRKLGFHVPTIKNKYEPENIYAKTYINPMKKMLYKLCENMDSNNFIKLKKTLLTYNIDTNNYESCELVLLELMCQKFISLSQFQYDKKVFGYEVKVDKLVKIIDSMPGFKRIASEIRTLQDLLNDNSKTNPTASTSTYPPIKVQEQEKQKTDNKYYKDDFDDLFDELKMHLEDAGNENLKCDTTKLGPDCYEIKNPRKVGLCVIINQEDFYPSKNSIENGDQCNALEKRIGSDKDKETLERTMKWLNFDVISETNIDHKKMFDFVKDAVVNKFSEEHSIFILCILSHGVRGHVYAADSVKVKMEDLQNLLDSDDAVRLHDIPKLIIIQACQVDETPYPELVADNPRNIYNKKTNFLIYWATAPELEAYRSERTGSVFIQRLCKIIIAFAKKHHIFDIFTKVTNDVTQLCTRLEYIQVPLFQSTLRKNLYLQIPK